MKTFTKHTGYNEYTATSYLLTNGKPESPGLIKDGFLEIKLYWGNTLSHFYFYQNVYEQGRSIFEYFQKYKYFKKNYIL
jgi:hypothetical protein